MQRCSAVRDLRVDVRLAIQQQPDYVHTPKVCRRMQGREAALLIPGVDLRTVRQEHLHDFLFPTLSRPVQYRPAVVQFRVGVRLVIQQC